MKFFGVISGGLLLWIFISASRSAVDISGKSALMAQGNIGLIQNLGKVLFSEYALPFEISSVLFLSAMVGAVVIGKRENTLSHRDRTRVEKPGARIETYSTQPINEE